MYENHALAYYPMILTITLIGITIIIHIYKKEDKLRKVK